MNAQQPEPSLRDLLELCGEVLGVAEVDPRDDFFALGGDSLKALRLATLAEDRWGRALSVVTLFSVPDFAALHAALTEPR